MINNISKGSYIDSILDLYGKHGERIIWELYLQNNLVEYCTFTKDDFDEIYFGLFDIIEFLISDEFVHNPENQNDDMLYDSDFCDIIYDELIDDAKNNYTLKQFIEDIDKSKWIGIIEESLITNEEKINLKIYNFNKEKYGTSKEST